MRALSQNFTFGALFVGMSLVFVADSPLYVTQIQWDEDSTPARATYTIDFNRVVTQNQSADDVAKAVAQQVAELNGASVVGEPMIMVDTKVGPKQKLIALRLDPSKAKPERNYISSIEYVRSSMRTVTYEVRFTGEPTRVDLHRVRDNFLVSLGRAVLGTDEEANPAGAVISGKMIISTVRYGPRP